MNIPTVPKKIISEESSSRRTAFVMDCLFLEQRINTIPTSMNPMDAMNAISEEYEGWGWNRSCTRFKVQRLFESQQ